MSEESVTFGEVRSLLQGAPDEAVWRRLCAMLDAWPDADDLAERVLPYAACHLDAWPESARRRAPRAWLARLRDDPRARVPALGLARSFRLSGLDADPVPIRALLDHPERGPIHELDVEHAALSRGVLRSIGGLEHLRSLRLWCDEISPVFAGLLMRSEHRHLRALDLGGNRLGPETWAGASDALPALESLCLSTSWLAQGTAEALAAMPWFAGLGRLDVRMTPVVGGGFRALVDRSSPARLRALRIGGCRLAQGDLAHLLRAPVAPGLRELDLGNHLMHYEADAMNLSVEPFRGFDHMPSRTQFDELVEHGASLTSLESLVMDGHELGVEDIERLVARVPLPNIRALDLSINGLGDDATRVVLESRWGRTLRSLQLGFNAASDEIFDGPPLDLRLEELSLRGTFLCDDGADALARQPWASGLTSLDLYQCSLSDEGLIALLGVLDASRLRELDLGSNGFTDRAAQALLDADLSALERLALDREDFSEAARDALQRRHPFVYWLDRDYDYE